MARDTEEKLWVCEPLCPLGHSVFVILHLYIFIGCRSLLL